MPPARYDSRFRFFSMGPDRFQLRTVNASCFPANPTHPRLVEREIRAGNERPPLQPDGTYGDRDWLCNTITYQRNRIWIHYIPTVAMWGEGWHGWEVPPIYLQPAQFGDGMWLAAGATGCFSEQLKTDLRRFHNIGVRHVIELRKSAMHYTRMPLYGDQLNWASIEGEGTYSSMVANLASLRRAIAEMYGWIFLQEKLQPMVPSICPRAPHGFIGNTPIPCVDHFTGVIVDWNNRNAAFDRMAMEHGVALWHVDYISDPQSKIAPWKGLAEGGAVVNTHRSGGYIGPKKTDIIQTRSVPIDPSGASKNAIAAIACDQGTPLPRVPPRLRALPSRPLHPPSLGESSRAASTAVGTSVERASGSTSAGDTGRKRPRATDIPDQPPADPNLPKVTVKRKRKNHYSKKQRMEIKAAAEAAKAARAGSTCVLNFTPASVSVY
ncbi:hypothetical protein BOTBODRAFT_182517 [Botryobasidium botryosum FD-172 SS1]|uniref:Uncharacterized protein n=1 Tax=Botryobasidium botryosum (strain FD-172 SS1) TaxID=930990 RepID=A0A067M0U3_BOTB1|nr:hypothetical protein BOTBODRAFT_182517 [Botryobasidium botryosum FD-172 SS1]